MRRCPRPHAHALTTSLLTIFLALGTSSANERDEQGNTLTDQQITEMVKSEFKETNQFERQALGAESHDGIVTLSGQVDALAAKRDAARIAKQVRGVRTVVNQIVVTGRDLDDPTIAACVRRALHEDPVIEKAEIAVTVDNGRVGITGAVSSLAEKQFAEDAVAEVAGVTEVNNQLIVDLNSHRNQDELQDEIDGLIENSLRFQPSKLTARVDGSKVVVQGTVGDAAEKDLLVRLLSVPGVSDVSVEGVQIDSSQQNRRLREKRQARIDDQSVEKAIQQAMLANPLVLSFVGDIGVDVQQGAVTLTGTVDRLRAKQAAQQTAQNTLGVRDVINEIEVQWSAGSPSDAEIIEQTQAAIQRNAYLDRRQIRVHSKQAHVHLYGVVDSLFEKQVATRTADSIRGVVHVANMLAVAPQWEPKPDDEIQQTLQQKLKQSLLEVDVQVRDGVAILSGEVDSWGQWQAALDLALEAGAKTPHNLIDVRHHPAHQEATIFVP